MVRRNAEADQPVGGGEAVEYVDLCVRALVPQDVLGRVEAGRARADDRDAQGVFLGADQSEREG
jgi:hypothetical protein